MDPEARVRTMGGLRLLRTWRLSRPVLERGCWAVFHKIRGKRVPKRLLAPNFAKPCATMWVCGSPGVFYQLAAP